MFSSGLLCNYSLLQRKGQPSRNTTECRPQDRCFSAPGLFGKSHILSAQGCVSRELCGTVQPAVFRGSTYFLNYTCCCRDQCNLPPEQDNTLRMLLRETKGSLKGAVTTKTTVDDCPEDNSLQENTKAKGGLGLKVLLAFN
ncbi:protein Bouncer-like isoform X2 [Conger conger]|uniref:protein Bouncer-like isoform X2 n=1 Tax=Conger conger TaxID=82655 RepID=UPI002A5A4C0B|nr:protein Bouncer-like isoform X2 [Conger conger]